MLPLPPTGFGTWRLHEPELSPAIREAVKIGYRHFDGAAIYENESELGVIFDELINEENIVARDQLFITSKLWVTQMNPKSVQSACEKSLKDWKMKYFDLYLIHWPFAFKPSPSGSTLCDENGVAVKDDSFELEDTWRAMEDLVLGGLCKNIGVSNFSINLLKRILSMPQLRIKPAVNQVELHPYLPQVELRLFCAEQDIVCEAYSSLGSGKEHPCLLNDTMLLELSSKLQVSPSQLLLSWARQQNIPVIPKSSNPARILQNFVHIPLSDEIMQSINKIQIRNRYVDPMNFWKHPMPQ